MREIKFRGKRLDNGEWVYGYAAKFAHGAVPVILEDSEDDGIESRKIIPDTIGQFTGLFDKNGKEIYEGDIIKAENVSHYVGYIEDQAMFVANIISRNPLMDYCSIFQTWIDEYNKVVIGNIYDNPELLNK